MQTLIPLDEADLNVRQRQLAQALTKEPKNVDLLYALASTEDDLDQTSLALEHLQNALSLSPRDEDILKNIGLIYLKMGKIDQAKIYLQRAASINSNNDEITFALGNTYFTSGNYESALNSYLKLKDKVLDDTDINYSIAMAYGKLNNNGESHYYFGLHFKKSKKKESALFHFKEALNYFPQGSEQSIVINNEIKELSTDSPPQSKSKSKR
jgi:tetratricopeptide (TPR) repeat protein